ncbi:MAG: hypothetical protein EBR09_09340 [Proteobacteria bacterium]|nr:hypothetical protein [Pseudomonadota bacterium]
MKNLILTGRHLNGLLLISAGCLFTACVTAPAAQTAPESGGRLYWKVYPKSDNTYYILPRPELTQSLSSPREMNSLTDEQARKTAGQLNASLQFRVQVENEGGTRITRVVPEPLLEDMIEICKAPDVHAVLQLRCKKELAWAAKGMRPDIYLQFSDCEAAAAANALNRLYGKNTVPQNICPAIPQVEK